MVTKVPLFASQTPSNAVRAVECCGWEMVVLMLLSTVSGRGVLQMCVQHRGGGMRACAIRCCVPLEGGAGVVGGGLLAVVFRSYVV